MVKRSTVIVVLWMLPWLLVLTACVKDSMVPDGAEIGSNRVVSMSPAVTEILYELGVGDRVAGVTRYCRIPAGEPVPARVGGYVDPDWEALVGLRPDLVFTMESHAAAEHRLAELGLKTLRVDHSSVAGILDSFDLIADACGVSDRGTELRERVDAQLQKVRERVTGSPRPRVLVVIGRDVGRGRVTSVWVAGRATFYDDILEWAGGVNALGDGAAAYPEIGPEGLHALDPDIVLDIVADAAERGASIEAAVADWRSLTSLRAVGDGRVRVLTGKSLVIPGPRLGEIVEAFADALHPNPEDIP